jgi:L-malate glycosyltransferase
MRILLLSAASSVHTLRWANAFHGLGHKVHLVTQHAPSYGYHKGVHIHPLPHRSGLGYLLNRARLRRLVDRLRPDVINTHYATGYGTLATAVRNVPVVLNVWGSDVFDFPGKSVLHKRWVRRNLLAATCVVSTSEMMADRTRQLVPERPRPTVVPFGVDTARFAPGTMARGAGYLVIGTVKTLAAKYGVDTLIRAFALVRKELPGVAVRMRIVGDGPERSALMSLCTSLSLADAIEFVGPVPHDQVPAQLGELDIFVALSRDDSESFGVAVIEASACGLPVVASDAGGLPEVVRNGVTGQVVPRNDPPAAAKALTELVASAELRQRWGSAGRAHVQANYEWEHCVDRMDAVLHEAAKKSRRA